mgnify:FL=1
MEKEMEIAVKVNVSYEKLEEELKQNNFIKKEEYIVNDSYLINSSINIADMKSLDILKKCVLVRDIVGILKQLLYKYKKYDNNGDIIEQGKIKCPVTDINKAMEFMNAIGYEKLFDIHDKCIVFANDKTELVVQLVNDKYIFIEMESKPQYINRKYENVEELKDDICSYNLSIDKSNFFVKKAELILNETLNR